MEDATAPAGLFLSLDQLIKKNTQVRRMHFTAAASILLGFVLFACFYACPHTCWSSRSSALGIRDGSGCRDDSRRAGGAAMPAVIKQVESLSAAHTDLHPVCRLALHAGGSCK
jgi:hypothetical protein